MYKNIPKRNQCSNSGPFHGQGPKTFPRSTNWLPHVSTVLSRPLPCSTYPAHAHTQILPLTPTHHFCRASPFLGHHLTNAPVSPSSIKVSIPNKTHFQREKEALRFEVEYLRWNELGSGSGRRQEENKERQKIRRQRQRSMGNFKLLTPPSFHPNPAQEAHVS